MSEGEKDWPPNVVGIERGREIALLNSQERFIIKRQTYFRDALRKSLDEQMAAEAMGDTDKAEWFEGQYMKILEQIAQGEEHVRARKLLSPDELDAYLSQTFDLNYPGLEK